MHVLLSILSQLFCRIKVVYFWFHLNVRPTCVIFANLYCPYVLPDTTTNHASGRIVENTHFPKPDFIGPIEE